MKPPYDIVRGTLLEAGLIGPNDDVALACQVIVAAVGSGADASRVAHLIDAHRIAVEHHQETQDAAEAIVARLRGEP